MKTTIEKQEVIVYTKNNCMPCQFTKRSLTDKGIPFTEINIDVDEDAMESIKAKGYTSVPLVVLNEKPLFTGFNQDGIQYLEELFEN